MDKTGSAKAQEVPQEITPELLKNAGNELKNLRTFVDQARVENLERLLRLESAPQEITQELLWDTGNELKNLKTFVDPIRTKSLELLRGLECLRTLTHLIPEERRIYLGK